MTKKVLILSSSPRRGGNSDTLCNEFMRGAIESGNEAEKVFLRDKTIHYCTGCSTCSLHGKPCPQKDDAARHIPGPSVGISHFSRFLVISSFFKSSSGCFSF